MRSLPVVPAVLLVLAAASPARAGDVPFLGAETPRGSHRIEVLPAAPPAAIAVDGDPGEWRGEGPGFGGTVVRSRGELVYTDHLFDAHGADDGGDAQRLALLAPLHDAAPGTYRFDALLQNDPAGQVGLPAPEQLSASTEHGDLGLQDRADLTEVRVAPAPGGLALLARTTTMHAAGDTAVLALLDTRPGDDERAVPFGSGLRTRSADVAVLLAGDRGWSADLATGAVTELPAGSVATRPDGYDNAVEARLPVTGPEVGLAVAAGLQNAAGTALANVANVAFRTAEPVREAFEREQALALHAGSIDRFALRVDLGALAAGANERWHPGPGYHDRIQRSSAAISREDGRDGVLQHYGLYLPGGWRADRPAPLQLWLHWRGGGAHSAGNVIPSMFEDLGDAPGAVVVSPRGRGSSTWYVGRGHADVLEVWADVHRLVAIDPSRRYVSGHSMGGWGSFLMTILHPDWFAAALPASPPVTQGAWTGIDFEGCDELQYDDYSPCFSGANGGDPRTQHTRRLLENVRHVPWAILHGTADELVPTGGVVRQQERLVELGLRHRLYLFHTQEHFGPPVWDQWREGTRYLHGFRRPAAPHRVTFLRDMPFERATERELDLDFDRAYWLSGLEPADAQAGVAHFDGRSHAIPERPFLAVPEVGGPVADGQTGPYTMTGLRWEPVPLAPLPLARNAFEATLRGSRAATLDAGGMRLDVARPIDGTVTTDAPLALTLTGLTRAPLVLLDGRPASSSFAGGAVTLTIPPGMHRLRLA